MLEHTVQLLNLKHGVVATFVSMVEDAQAVSPVSGATVLGVVVEQGVFAVRVNSVDGQVHIVFDEELASVHNRVGYEGVVR